MKRERIKPSKMKSLKSRDLNILDACTDPALFAPFFKTKKSWQAWFAFLACLFGLPMDKDQLQIFRQCTGRTTPSPNGYLEAWLVIGRRGGKSFILSLIATYLAAFMDWRVYLGPGERAVVMVIAADRKQSRVIMRYVKGLIKSVPMLSGMLEGERLESIDLNNQVTVEVHTASFRTTRGYAIVAALCDEAAFWATDETAAEPDTEILNAVRPGMASIPNSMLLVASSPYARKGELFNAYRKFYGKDNPALVWQAPTRTMNPSIPLSVVETAMERDPASASAEYLAQFRADIEGFVNFETVQACVSVGVRERAPQAGLRYFGFVDPSGGSNDSFTLGISHRDGDSLFLDAVREIRPPFSPEGVVVEFAWLLKSYRINRIVGDRYAGEFPREMFRKNGITYEPSAKPKSDLYRDLLPLLNSRKVDLLDHPRLIMQLVGLERRTARSGRDSIDHSPGQHDDIANCVAGALTSIAMTKPVIRLGSLGVNGCELDVKTGRPFEKPWHHPLKPGIHQHCNPGKGMDPAAAAFNAQHGIIAPLNRRPS